MATDPSALIQAGLQTMTALTALAPSGKRRRKKKKKAKTAAVAVVPTVENPKPAVPTWAWWALGLAGIAGVGGAVWWGVKRKKDAAALADAQVDDDGGDGVTTNERVLALVNQFNTAAAAETEAGDHARAARVRKLMAAPRSNIGTTNSGNSGRLADDVQVFKPTRGAVI